MDFDSDFQTNSLNVHHSRKRRGVLLQRHLCPADIVVFEDVFMQDIVKIPFIENEHMVQAFSSKRYNDPLATAVLPG